MRKKLRFLSAFLLMISLLLTSFASAQTTTLQPAETAGAGKALAALTKTVATPTLSRLGGKAQEQRLNGQLTGVTVPQISVHKQDLLRKKEPVPAVAQAAIAKGVKPGSFSKVTAKLKPNVVDMDEKTYDQLTSALTENKLDPSKFGLDSSKIYVSSKNGASVKFTSDKDSKSLYAVKPGFSEVVDTFNIPEQTVDLNVANISSLAEGISATSKKAAKNYALQMPQTKSGKSAPPPPPNSGGDDVIVLTFSENLYKGFSDSGSSMDFRINGTLELIKPQIRGKYSKFSGYKLEFLAGEKFNLHSEAILTIDETFKIPIEEFSIPAQLGKARIGLYLVIDVNGDMRLAFDVNQGLALNAGVKGGTFFYIPTSVNPFFSLERWCTLSSKFNGQLNAFIGPSAEVELEALGYDLLEVVTRTGVETKIKVEGNDMDIKAGFRFKIYGEVIGKNFTAINKYVGFLDERRQHTGKYEVKLTKADAYTDKIEGSIVKPVTLDRSDPYTGTVTVKITGADGVEKSRKNVTGNNKGDFVVSNANLYKGDKVYVLVPESTDNWFGALDVTFPFTDAELYYADYFMEKIHATVAAGSKEIAKTDDSTQTEGDRIGALQTNDTGLNYSGPATVILTPYDPVAYTLSSAPVNTDSLSDVWDANTKPLISVPIDIANGEYKSTLRNNPLKPYMQAQLRIEYKGFVLQSAPIWTDGLMLTPVKTEGYSLSIDKTADRETVYGNNSFVLVSSVRSGKTPGGTIQMYAGYDMPHRTEQYKDKDMYFNYSQVLDKPLKQQLINPMFYFDRSIPLKSFKPSTAAAKAIDGGMSVETTGMAIGETGSWTASITGLNPEVRDTDVDGDRHAFESIRYQFEGVDLGYSNLELQCRFCKIGADSYRWSDTDWEAKGLNQFDITHGNMDINNLDGMGQLINNPNLPGTVVNPGRMDRNTGR